MVQRLAATLALCACAGQDEPPRRRGDGEVGPTPGGLCLVQGCRADASATDAATAPRDAPPNSDAARPLDVDAPATPGADSELGPEADAAVAPDASAGALDGQGPPPADAGIDGPCAPRLRSPCEIVYDACCPGGAVALLCYPDVTGTLVWQPVPYGFECRCAEPALDTTAECHPIAPN